MNVGIVGLGHVGRAAAVLLKKARGVRLTHIADPRPTRKVRGLGLARSTRVSRDWRRLVSDPALDVVVELVGGLHPAREIVLGALRSGKDVVTANKLLLSERWTELHEAAAATGRALRFEGSVGGGIPLIRPLHEDLAASPVREVVGILNGTTNYLLCEMAKTGRPFREVLAEAQRLGFAERDPGFDLRGLDVAHKVSVLASMLGGGWLPSRDIPTDGIERIGADDLAEIRREFGLLVKLVGRLQLDAGRVRAAVHPALIDAEHPLAGVHGPYNAVLVRSEAAKTLMFYGPGAGPFPAASAVVADILALERGAGSSAQGPFRRRLTPADPGRAVSAQGLRLFVQDRPGVLAGIAREFGRHGVSIARIVQTPAARSNKFGVRILALTHPAAEAKTARAIAGLRAMREVSPDILQLRVLP